MARDKTELWDDWKDDLLVLYGHNVLPLPPEADDYDLSTQEHEEEVSRVYFFEGETYYGLWFPLTAATWKVES